MQSEFAQLSLIGWVIAAIVVVALLALAVGVFLFVRLTSQRTEREGLAREQQFQIERAAQFAAYADRVPFSRNSDAAVSLISDLFRDYLSIRVVAIYAGSKSESVLSRLHIDGGAESTTYPDFAVPEVASASLLERLAGPTVATTLALTSDLPSELSARQTMSPAADTIDATAGVALSEHETSPNPSLPMGRKAQEVLLYPWRGPFGWSGLIVGTPPAGITPEALEPYREAITHLTDRLAITLELQRDQKELEVTEQRAARITSFSQALISCLEEAAPLDAIVKKVTELAGTNSAALWRVDESDSMVKMVAAYGLKAAEFLPLPVGQGLAGNIVQTGESLAVEDAPADPRCIFPREARESGIASYLGAPLVLDGRALGVIEAHSASRRSWSEGDRRALESVAAIIAELIKSTDSRGNRLRVESAYLGLSEALQRLRSPDEVTEAVVEVLGHALGASRVLFVEFNEQGQATPVKQEYRQASAKSAVGADFGDVLVAKAQASVGGQPIVIADSREGSLMGAEKAAELDVASEFAVPMRADGKVRAVVYVHQCDRNREWKEEEIEFAERVARQLSLSLSNLRALAKASADAEQARAEAREATEENASARIRELEQKLESLERVLLQSRDGEEQARAMLAKASALEAKARAEAEVARRDEAELRKQLDRIKEDHKQVQGSAQQLIEINRLKSEFIVNAGREIEASLQSVLGVAELLERGSYGNLTTEQREAVHNLYGWARRIKSDVDWLIEYGSARSRRLESSGGS